MRATSTALRSPEAHLALTYDRPNYCEQALLKWADVRGMFRGKSTLVRFADDGAPRTARRGGRCKTNSEQPCCTRDEGGPLGLGLQDQGSNHRKLLRHNGFGAERCGKGGSKSVRCPLVSRTQVNR